MLLKNAIAILLSVISLAAGAESEQKTEGTKQFNLPDPEAMEKALEGIKQMLYASQGKMMKAIMDGAANNPLRDTPDPSKFKVRQVGQSKTLTHRAYLTDESGKVISPLHDVSAYVLKEKALVNMVVEKPRFTTACMEISKSEPMNPIMQEEDFEEPRFISSVFPYHGFLWNVGSIPQTWSSSKTKDALTGLPGSDRPIEVLEISSVVANVGDVKRVKIIGAIPLQEDDQIHWKIIALDMNDALCLKIKTVEDIEKYMPGLLHHTQTFFRVYRIPERKQPGAYVLEGKIQDEKAALEIIDAAHNAWKDLISGKEKAAIPLALVNRNAADSAAAFQEELPKVEDKLPAKDDLKPIDPEDDFGDEFIFLNPKAFKQN